MKKNLWNIIKNKKDETLGDIVNSVIERCAKEIYGDEIISSINIPIPEAKGKYGDLSSEIAFKISSKVKKNPKVIAEEIAKKMSESTADFSTEAISGYLNLKFSESFLVRFIKDKLLLNEPRLRCLDGLKILVEFVSANPTGPIHIGHGRIAAVGTTIANLLKYCGAKVDTEFYINDRGNQIESLGRSIKAYKTKKEDDADIEYRGEYVKELAEKIDIVNGLTFSDIGFRASKIVMENIKKSLSDFGTSFDNFVSETKIVEDKYVVRSLEKIKEFITKVENTTFFMSSKFGDEKDRVVIKSNGELTYFASDIGYHLHKIERGYDMLINIWGADHHGYIKRMESALSAIGFDTSNFFVVLVQMVNLLKDGKSLQMSKREGTYITLDYLLNTIGESGKDVARFLYLTKSPDSHLDFDLDLALKKTEENPVFYVQYAHARISSVFKEAEKRGFKTDNILELDFKITETEEEREILSYMAMFLDEVRKSALGFDPHLLTFYLSNLASMFHSYYHTTKILVEDEQTRNWRLFLIYSTAKVLKEGLTLLGVSAPERM